jgi:hypothetical protein
VIAFQHRMRAMAGKGHHGARITPAWIRWRTPLRPKS